MPFAILALRHTARSGLVACFNYDHHTINRPDCKVAIVTLSGYDLHK